jgi:hypothetical protein
MRQRRNQVKKRFEAPEYFRLKFDFGTLVKIPDPLTISSRANEKSEPLGHLAAMNLQLKYQKMKLALVPLVLIRLESR